MDLLNFIGLAILFSFLVRLYSRTPSSQLWILSHGFKKIPNLLLRLAKIEKTGEVGFDDLSKAEVEKIWKVIGKLENVASVRLTFLFNQNLIHIQSESQNWFFSTDNSGGQNLIEESIGKLDDRTGVEYILYRRKGNFFKTPVLIGYLRKNNEIGHLKDEEKEIEILFEFPENLVKNPLIKKYLMEKFKITLDENDIIADYSKNELGDDESLYCVNYRPDNKYGGFEFRIYP